MTHYAKLAAITFRLFAVTGFLYFLPGFFLMFRMSGAQGMSGFGSAMGGVFSGMILYPVIAVVLFVAAKPLGMFVARGLE